GASRWSRNRRWEWCAASKVSGRGAVTDIGGTNESWLFIHGNRRRETLFWDDSLRPAQHGSAQLQTLRTRRVSSKGLLSRANDIPGVWSCRKPCRGNCSVSQRATCLMASPPRAHRSAPPPCCPRP